MTDQERQFWLALAALGVIPWLFLGIAHQLGFRIMPPQRTRAVPWGATECLLLVASFIAQFAPSLSHVDSDRTTGMLRQVVIAGAQLGFIVQVSLPIFMLTAGRARLYQLGLHGSRLGRNVLLGVGSYFLVVPLVALAFVAAAQWFEPTRHSLEQWVRESPSPSRFLLSGLVAVVLAPLYEELVFRGILLLWLRRVVGAGPAILMTSLLFAELHVNAWPAPIPLFVLAVFLGYLSHRTASLIAPIMLHATFNGVNIVWLMVMVSGRS